MAAKNLQAVQLYLATWSNDVAVVRIDLWDGGIQVKSVNVNWYSSTEGAYELKTLALGTKHTFSHGLGISIDVQTGASGILSHRLVIAGVGVK